MMEKEMKKLLIILLIFGAINTAHIFGMKYQLDLALSSLGDQSINPDGSAALAFTDNIIVIDEYLKNPEISSTSIGTQELSEKLSQTIEKGIRKIYVNIWTNLEKIQTLCIRRQEKIKDWRDNKFDHISPANSATTGIMAFTTRFSLLMQELHSMKKVIYYTKTLQSATIKIGKIYHKRAGNFLPLWTTTAVSVKEIPKLKSFRIPFTEINMSEPIEFDTVLLPEFPGLLNKQKEATLTTLEGLRKTYNDYIKSSKLKYGISEEPLKNVVQQQIGKVITHLAEKIEELNLSKIELAKIRTTRKAKTTKEITKKKIVAAGNAALQKGQEKIEEKIGEGEKQKFKNPFAKKNKKQ
jgi:hypothetical protein